MQVFSTCTLKELCPEDKQKVAQLVKQVRSAGQCTTGWCCGAVLIDQQLSLCCACPAGGGAGQGEPAAESSGHNGMQY